ncbi:MAG: dihydrolipoamide acetyltransferase family protein [Chloroflexota bacterium]|nr:2-oxo acid dehydrogenase subunit E2 [Chloroflexota bacterium]MBI5703639.1 2-oxo acid dehydrogenase subunit E2 [Chloroflexota bacterium]
MAETINMPKLGFDMAEGMLVRWVKQVGEEIKKGEVLAEIETDKATVEVESPASGVVLQHIVEQGTVVPVNAPIAVVGAAGEKVDVPSATPSKVESRKSDAAVQTPPAPAPTPQASAPAESGFVKASPLAKKIARDHNINLASIQGTGPGGRVVRKDVEAALSSNQSSVIGVQSAQPITTYQLPTSTEDKVVPTTKLRQAIGRRLVESKQTIPHFYVTHEYKMDALMEMRKQANAFLPDNEKLSVNDFIVKAVALALRQFPNLNATIKGSEIIQFGHVNVGVAVTVPGGLMTVVVKDADVKPMRQISSEIKAMAARAREGKVKPEDVDGSTFSTSNLGMYDVDEFIAIINPPEAAILAIGSAKEVPVVENGQIKTGWRMKATISVDHRVSDGAEAAQFMQKLAEFLENPVRMLV